jgi:predicted dehydrogenase
LKTFVVIGIGKLGLRHLEGIINSGIYAKIIAIDKDISTLENVKKIIREINHLGGIEFKTKLPKNINIDIAIVSTDSKNRFDISKFLIQNNNVKNLILEKVVFSNSKHFRDFSAILNNSQCNCYVNLPRRLFPHYQLLKEYINKKYSFSAKISGGTWGLASNALHFIDLLQYLFDSKIIKIDTKKLGSFFPSKRSGYLEIDGILTIEFENNSFAEIICSKEKFEHIHIELSYEDTNVDIIEKEGAFLNITNKNIQIPIKQLMVIDTTAMIIQKILNNEDCLIPPFSEVKANHEFFVNSLINYFTINKKLISEEFHIT